MDKFEKTLSEERAANDDRHQEVTRSLSAMENSHAAEEQVRQQHGFHLQESIDRLQTSMADESQARIGMHAHFKDEVAALHRKHDVHDERHEHLGQRLGSEVNEVRKRLVNETALREGTAAQLDRMRQEVVATKVSMNKEMREQTA